jgi:hypothetical protein
MHEKRQDVWMKLPLQCLKVFMKPTMQTFSEVKKQSTPFLVWIQFITLGILSGLFSSLLFVLSYISTYDVEYTKLSTWLGYLAPSIAIAILLPLSLLIALSILHLLSRWFGGNGSFLSLAYVSLLFNIPLLTLAAMAARIVIVSPSCFQDIYLPEALRTLCLFVSIIYALILQVVAVKSVYQLSLWKTLCIVLIPLLMSLVLFGGAIFTIMANAQSLQPLC